MDAVLHVVRKQAGATTNRLSGCYLNDAVDGGRRCHWFLRTQMTVQDTRYQEVVARGREHSKLARGTSRAVTPTRFLQLAS